MAATLQHEAATLSFRIQTASTREHHPLEGKADDALTFKLDQSTGAGQIRRARAQGITKSSALSDRKDRYGRWYIMFDFIAPQSTSHDTIIGFEDLPLVNLSRIS